MNRKKYDTLQSLLEEAPLEQDQKTSLDGWLQIVGEVTNQLSQIGGQSIPVVAGLNAIRNRLKVGIDTGFDPEGISIDVPTIDTEAISAVRSAIRSDLAKLAKGGAGVEAGSAALTEIVSPYIAQIIFELRLLIGSEQRNSIPSDDPIVGSAWINPFLSLYANASVASEYASYAAWKSLDHRMEDQELGWSRSLEGAIDLQKQRFDGLFAELQSGSKTLQEIRDEAISSLRTISEEVTIRRKEGAEVGDLIRDLSAQVHDLREQIKLSESYVIAAEAKSTSTISKIENIDTVYDGFKSAIEARFKIQAPKELWEIRRGKAAKAFYISAIMLAIALIILPGIAVYNYRAIILVVQNISDALIAVAKTDGGRVELSSSQLTIVTINRLLIIAFPLALYVWAAKLLVRYTVRSLALADDATMRQTVVDSYYRLNADHQLTPEDARLMLTALFRPAPGQSADSSDFPDVIEFVTKAAATK
ncbi:hypothetical protein [Rhizobium johnstonii]|uniref:hypothetical protein n=1 Tax=Rhizobium johnstonii TaxID=3019933 RepID=UPI003F9B0569